MQPNPLREKLNNNQPIFGTMIEEVRSTALPILFAHAGFDFVFLDMEHGPFSIETIADLIRICRLANIAPLVRVPSDAYHWIARISDAGAVGFMVPRVESVVEARQIVQFAKYPPLGKRGCSITKGHNDFRRAELYEFTTGKNEQNMVIIQVERKSAVEQIDEILSIPGVDGVIIGPKDLALSLGVPEDFNDPVTQAAIGRVVQACQAHGKFSGMHTAAIDTLLAWYRKGMRCLVWTTEMDMLRTASEQGLQKLRQGAA